jgi:hypothetical protein
MKKLFALFLMLAITVTTFANTVKQNHKNHKQSIHNGRKYGVYCHNYLTTIG